MKLILKIEENADPLEAKIEIIAKPKGKRPTSIELLSGGEKTLTAIALLFSIYLVKPSPFCILDEIDAPLDDANIDRFTRILDDFSKDTQFIVVTHNKRTMEAANTLYGVTMQEEGISKLVSVRFNEDLDFVTN
ncbi:MAG: AAA family ATPase [Ignavibacteriales bacterium]|nr:AAA family ATPase [Ignavibacteriales bacterium]